MTYNMTTRKKRRAAIIAVTCAILVALSGTFAWQSISQQALNEAKGTSNPGGRLHDDYSGPDGTKDVYVENFGDQDIFARVRLDEYMEIGKGAGTKGTYNTETGTWNVSENNKATSLVNGANINDVTTWTTHLPGATDENISTGNEAGTQWSDSSKTFNNYFTWTMGGQDTKDNPTGQTVYMPTFNKNRDSLAADINGTLEGNETGAYGDYVPYTEGQKISGTEYVDADDNNIDEGNGTGKGDGGTVDVNYTTIENVTHTAAETLEASVITMQTYKDMDEADKKAFQGWVWDADGWAYWSQPIKTGTATGLLLDKVSFKDKADEWYYGINVVAQFVTANDLGQTGENATGFFTEGGAMPSNDALDLLQRAGVNVNGITLTTDDEAAESISGVTTIVPGSEDYTMTIKATSAKTVDHWSWASDDQDKYITAKATDGKTSIGTITVKGSAEAAGHSAVITVTAYGDADNTVIGSTTFTVKVGDYLVTVENTDNAEVATTGTSFTARSTKAGGTDATSLEGATWSWTVGGAKASSFTITNETAATAKVAATETATNGDTATVTATYTDKEGKTASYSFDVTANVAGA